jgi:hypothetical protein
MGSPSFERIDNARAIFMLSNAANMSMDYFIPKIICTAQESVLEIRDLM